MELKFTGTFKTTTLMDELLTAFPEWLVGAGEDKTCLITLWTKTGEAAVYMSVPDGADTTRIAAVIAAHDPAKLSTSEIMTAAQQAAKIGFTTLPDWARTMTAQQAANYINGQIWNGSTKAQVDTWIDGNIVNITTANVAQINAQLANIRAALKLTAGAVLAMRDLFILTAKLLVYIRDLVIRFRA